MSTDFFPATRTKPTEGQVRAFFATRAGVSLRGTWENGGNIMVETESGLGSMIVDPPEPVRSDDDDEPVRLLRPRPRWALMISVSAIGGREGIDLALSLSRRLVKLNGGATYDLQADEFVWPDGRRETRRHPSQRAVTVLQLEWHFPLSRLSTQSIERFVGIAETTMPQVLPRKSEKLCSWSLGAWRERYNSVISWSTRKPCFAASAFAAESSRPERGLSAWQLQVNLDADAFEARPGRWERVEALFLDIADGLDAFHAFGVVDRNYILVGRSLGFVASKMPVRYARTPWDGLPAFPTWLTWFGLPYRDLVGEAVADMGPDRGNGRYLRVGPTPMDSEVIASQYPHLPENLVRVPRQKGDLPAALIPRLE